MSFRSPTALACGLLVTALTANHAAAQVNETPRELAGVGIDEKPGALLPRDVELKDQDGKAVRLGDYLDGERPLIVVFAYFRCPMLCSMVLNGLGKGMKELAWNAGDRFRVVTISIDPTDTPAMAKAKRENQLAAYGRRVPERGWDFLTGDAAQTKRAADALGFHYQYDARQKQYAHAAGAFVFTKDGKLSRTLYGITFPEENLRLSLVEASEGKLGTPFEKLILLCYHYDPQANGYVLGAMRLMRLGGVLTIAALAFMFARIARKAKRKPDPDSAARSSETPSEDPV